MYNKELFEKIVNVRCSYEELESFVREINKKDFDLDKPFEKYYSLENILNAITRYENNEIDDRYLSCWMNAFNWIIMAGFKIESEDEEITFEQWVIWEISDLLDSLSFFDSADEWYNLENYKNSLKIIDKIYKNINDWDCVFAYTDEWGDNEDDVILLVTNNKTKEYVKIYGNLDYSNEKFNFSRIDGKKLQIEIERLEKADYQELKYGLFDYNEA